MAVKQALDFPLCCLCLQAGFTGLQGKVGTDSVFQKSQCGQANSTQGIHNYGLFSCNCYQLISNHCFEIFVLFFGNTRNDRKLLSFTTEINKMPLFVPMLCMTAPLPF